MALPHGGVHVESGVRPREHAGGLVLVEEFEAYEEPEHGAAEAAVGHEEMQMRMPVGAQPLRHGEHHLPVRHRREQRGVEPLGPDSEALGMAAGAALAARAGYREQVLVRAGIAADAGEPVLEHPAGEELVGHVADHRTPPDATGRTRGRSGRRRPSAGDAGGLISTERAATRAGVVVCRRRATGCFDATSACARLTMLAVAVRTDHQRHATHRAVRSQQKPAGSPGGPHSSRSSVTSAGVRQPASASARSHSSFSSCMTC